MGQVIWSPQAIDDLERICEFIARDSERYAQLVAEAIVDQVVSAGAAPLRGWEVSEYGRADIRERLYKYYRIVYRVQNTAIEVITIAHGSKPLSTDMP
jgi:toxin ParE1/3/4